MYERAIGEALERAMKTGCTGVALEKHVARELGCDAMTPAQLDAMQRDFEKLVWPVTRAASGPARRKSKAAQRPNMF